MIFGGFYIVMYIIQLTQTKALARQLILIAIVCSGEISYPKHYVQNIFLLKILNKMFCVCQNIGGVVPRRMQVRRVTVRRIVIMISFKVRPIRKAYGHKS